MPAPVAGTSTSASAAMALAAGVVVLIAVITGQTGPELAVACTLGWTLLALGWIDLRYLVLPDALTLPLLLLGLVVAWVSEPARLLDRAAGAIVGYASLSMISALYRRLRGRDGLGAGDAKLLAAGGAWIGWQSLPVTVLISAFAGIAIALLQRARGRALTGNMVLPFGPCLAIAIWSIWLLNR